MTTYTRQMLINEAFSYLFPSTGQSPEDEDSDKIDLKVDALLEELSARGVVDIADVSDIEPQYFMPLAECLANQCAPSFALPKNPAVQEAAEDRLRIMVNRGGETKLTIDPALQRRRANGLSLARWRQGG